MEEKKKKLLGIDRAKHSPDRGGAAGALAFRHLMKNASFYLQSHLCVGGGEGEVKREGRGGGSERRQCRQQAAVSDSRGESPGNLRSGGSGGGGGAARATA